MKILKSTPTCFDLNSGDTCDAVRWTVSNAQHHKGHHVHLLHVLLPQHRD